MPPVRCGRQARGKGRSGLVQKRQRLGRILGAQLRDGPPDVTGQRPGQVRLVEVPELVDDLVNGQALLDQHRRLPGPPICLTAPRVSPVAATKCRWTVRSDMSAGAPRSAATTTGARTRTSWRASRRTKPSALS